jgi:hypothetical protein
MPFAKKGHQTTQDRILTDERDREFYALRKQGWELDAIAKKYGCCIATVHNGVKRHMNKLDKLDKQYIKLTEIGVLQDARKMALTIANDPTVANKDKVAAINSSVAIAKRLSELLGLDDPHKSDLTSGGEPLQIVTNIDLKPENE